LAASAWLREWIAFSVVKGAGGAAQAIDAHAMTNAPISFFIGQIPVVQALYYLAQNSLPANWPTESVPFRSLQAQFLRRKFV
jgi:hypothetical protein